MEFINSQERRENVKKHQKKLDDLVLILAQKGVISSADVEKVRNKE